MVSSRVDASRGVGLDRVIQTEAEVLLSIRKKPVWRNGKEEELERSIKSTSNYIENVRKKLERA